MSGDQIHQPCETCSPLAAAKQEARSRERERLARDLHDSVSQYLFSLRLHARALTDYSVAADGAGSLDPARVRRSAEEMLTLASTALADLRDLIFDVRPAGLAALGLRESILAHADEVTRLAGLRVVAEAPAEPLHLEPDLEQDVYRIVQEALHNVVKHARASTAWIRVTAAGPGVRSRVTSHGHLIVEIEDDGKGLGGGQSGDLSRHLGLTSMAERAGRWGGVTRVSDGTAGGTLVRAVIPLAASPATRPALAGSPVRESAA